MTRSPLLCCTSIIRSSPLVQASSSLSMICARAWPTGATRQRNPFPPFFARVFSFNWSFHTHNISLFWPQWCHDYNPYYPCLIFIHYIRLRVHWHGLRQVGVWSVNPQPWRFTNNSLGLPDAPFLSVCLFPWVWVVCVCFLPYLSFYLCCARCVFCVLIYIYNHPFVFFFPFLQI